MGPHSARQLPFSMFKCAVYFRGYHDLSQSLNDLPLSSHHSTVSRCISSLWHLNCAIHLVWVYFHTSRTYSASLLGISLGLAKWQSFFLAPDHCAVKPAYLASRALIILVFCKTVDQNAKPQTMHNASIGIISFSS